MLPEPAAQVRLLNKSKVSKKVWRRELLRRSSVAGARLALVVMLGRVEVEDFLALARTRVDRAHVFAALHFPNCRDDSVFFDSVIGDVFRRGRLTRTFGACLQCGFRFGHRTFDSLL